MGYTGKSLHKNSPPRQSEYLAWRRTPRTFSLEGQWGLSVGATEDWEKQRICYGSKDTGSRSPRGYWLPWALLEVPLSSLRPSPTEKPTDSSAGNPQAKEPTGEEHSPSDQKIGSLKPIFKSWWAHSYLRTHPLSLPACIKVQALPYKGQHPAPSTREEETVSQQEACTKPWICLTTRGQT